jgi:hypothetical protein
VTGFRPFFNPAVGNWIEYTAGLPFSRFSATALIGPAVAGAKSTRHLPCVGANHLPPMKFSYLGMTETMLPGRPGGIYFLSSGRFGEALQS